MNDKPIKYTHKITQGHHSECYSKWKIGIENLTATRMISTHTCTKMKRRAMNVPTLARITDIQAKAAMLHMNSSSIVNYIGEKDAQISIHGNLVYEAVQSCVAEGRSNGSKN